MNANGKLSAIMQLGRQIQQLQQNHLELRKHLMRMDSQAAKEAISASKPLLHEMAATLIKLRHYL